MGSIARLRLRAQLLPRLEQPARRVRAVLRVQETVHVAQRRELLHERRALRVLRERFRLARGARGEHVGGQVRVDLVVADAVAPRAAEADLSWTSKSIRGTRE